jgi:hypothetical protein
MRVFAAIPRSLPRAASRGYDSIGSFVRKVCSIVGLHAPLGAALLGLTAAANGCMVTTDPTLPCSARDVGKAEVGTVVNAATAPVMAVAAAPTPYVLQWGEDGALGERTLLRHDEQPLSPGSAVLLTSGGSFVVAIDQADGAVLSWRLDVPADSIEALPRPFYAINDEASRPHQLVASLRGSDAVIVRDKEGHLAVWDPSKSAIESIDGDRPELKVVAIGDQNLVAREIRGNDDDILYLVDATTIDILGPKALLRGGPFTAVSLAPDDTHVIATAGSGDDAETFVFEIPSGELVDRFIGAQIVGRIDLEVLPGLRAVSPDGSVVAYRTAAGSLALREIAEQSSCLLRSATSGRHTLAGFAADGTVYFESEVDTGDTRVLAFDLIERHIAALGPAGESWRLAAVPARPGDASPWAIAVHEGVYAALQEGAQPEGVALNEAAFLPRDDAAVWAIDSQVDYSAGAPHQRLTTRRIEPIAVGERSWSFDDDDGAQKEVSTDSVAGSQRVCLSTGAPGSWGYRCGESGDDDFFSGAPLPDSEDPNGDGEGPEVPNDDDPAAIECAAPGWSSADTSRGCPFIATELQCCYEDSGTACAHACGHAACNTIPGEGPTYVTCASG